MEEVSNEIGLNFHFGSEYREEKISKLRKMARKGLKWCSRGQRRK